MISLDVEIENQAPLASIISGLASQIPYAASVAINNTLNDVQSAIQKNLPAEFTLRRADFISRTIYIAPSDRARKDRLVGTVRVNPARNFLAKFEDGGEKTSRTGHALAVPIVRATDKTLIIQRGDPLALKNVMAAIADRGGKLGKKQRGKKLGPVRQIKGASVYIVKSAKGTFIIQRTGPQSSRVLYAFERQVPIPDSLHFEEIALPTALANWEKNVDEAIAKAIETMR